MATQIPFPHLSDESTEGVLVTWFVEEGDEMAEGDLLASVQVEKVEEDLYAPVAGRVLHLLAGPGDVVAQGATIAELVGPDEAPAAAPDTGATAGETSARSTASAPALVTASPSAKRVARELGVDLTTVQGTGPGGRVVEDDVRRASAAPAATRGVPAGPAAAGGVPLPGPRRLLAEGMHSWKEATAQITLTTEVDVTDLAALDPPWAAALVRASALVLPRHPLLTRRWDGDLLVPAASIDVGVAVALDDGLVVPVVRGADGKAMATVAAEVADLSGRAREGRLERSEVSGAVFSVTSLGRYPVDAFTPLLQFPQTAILGVGRARQVPMVRDGVVVVGTTLTLSLTVDHRVIDGAPAAAFLEDLASVLGAPDRL